MRLVIAESAVTAAFFAVPIMTPFYHEVGLNQEEIALTQMAFTAVVMLLNVPLGFVADKFSRKWTNVAGDLLGAIAFLLYAMAGSFWTIVFCEVLLGVAQALSHDVDSTLLRHFCKKENGSEEYVRSKHAKMVSFRKIATLVYYLLGGPIGAISFRLAIALSSVTELAGAIIGAFIEDDSEKFASVETGGHKPRAGIGTFIATFREMFALVKRNMRNGELRTRIAAFAVARQMTHGIIWCFTPLMLYVGVPLKVVSLGWAFNAVSSYFGTLLARRFAPGMSEARIFLTPIVLVSIASTVMAVNLNILTVCLYALLGVAEGWSGATMAPIVKERVAPAEQTSIGSFASVVSDLLYIGAVWVINRAADVQLQYALVATVAIFVPLAIPIALKLRRVPTT